MGDLFENLKSKIVNHKDQILFNEVESCVDGKALRAAYIINWVCIAESLKMKFEEMSIRDSEIQKKVIGKVAEMEESKRATDKFLIEKAFEYGLINYAEKLKLEHINTLRGIYAHPIGNAPSEHELFSAVQTGVDAVLSKPSLLRHNYVNRILKSLFEEHHFIDTSHERIEEFAIQTTLHIHPDVVLHMLKELVEKLDAIIYKPDMYLFYERALVFGREFLRNYKNELKKEEWNLQGLVTKYPKAGGAIFISAKLWSNLNIDLQDTVLGHVLEPIIDSEIINPKSEMISSVFGLIYSVAIDKTHQIERFWRVFRRLPLSVKASSDVPLNYYIDEINRMIATIDWPTQNVAISYVKKLGNTSILNLTNEQQVELGRNLLQSSEGGAKSAIAWLKELSYDNNKWASGFVKGVFFETLFNDDGKIRLKTKYIKEAFSFLSCLDLFEIIETIDEATNVYSNKNFKQSHIDINDFKKASRIIERTIENYSEQTEYCAVVPSLQKFHSIFVESMEGHKFF
ncbi:hypothetical protein [Paenibacillus sp. P46E]|uniref:hypothetical protein n=1 Tax=Paenibacillus sp. P46E TaxID=1349436 RepID=UPI000938D7C2|nr:hypothetical protein [Paenibacillus sp. P46E]OKP95176.1 hypothetical protein A3849_26685 [Paenibacillus sp. P46E]